MWNVVGVAAHQQRGGIAQIFGFALRACISEGVLYMNCLYGSHFQHNRLIPSLWRARLHIRLFENKSVSTEPGANIGFKFCELEKRPSC